MSTKKEPHKKEENMEKILNELGVVFSRKHIAKNNHFFRVAKSTKKFWDWYKDHKAELKEAGYSVYKDADYGYCIYDWTDTTIATAEEVTQYHKEEEHWEEYRVSRAYDGIYWRVEDRGTLEDLELVERYIGCNDWFMFDELLDKIYVNPEYMREEILSEIPGPFLFADEEEVEQYKERFLGSVDK